MTLSELDFTNPHSHALKHLLSFQTIINVNPLIYLNPNFLDE